MSRTVCSEYLDMHGMISDLASSGAAVRVLSASKRALSADSREATAECAPEVGAADVPSSCPSCMSSSPSDALAWDCFETSIQAPLQT